MPSRLKELRKTVSDNTDRRYRRIAAAEADFNMMAIVFEEKQVAAKQKDNTLIRMFVTPQPTALPASLYFSGMAISP